MSIQEQIAAARDPHEALAVIGRALDALNVKLDEALTRDHDTGWGNWDPVESLPTATDEGAPEYNVKLEVDEKGDVIVEVPPVSEEKQAARRLFATEVLKLDEHFPGLDLIDSYAKVGPLLLYNSRRDFVAGLPYGMQLAMVNDVLEESPREATEMGRDLFRSAEGVDVNFAATAIDQIRSSIS